MVVITIKEIFYLTLLLLYRNNVAICLMKLFINTSDQWAIHLR